MVGARPEGKTLRYPVSELAARYGASVAQETSDPRVAYADWGTNFEPVRVDWPPSSRKSSVDEDHRGGRQVRSKAAVTETDQLLDAAGSVLVVDWPSRDVPDTLARAGYTVVVKGGPGLEDYSVYELRDGEIVVRSIGRAPEHADLLYCHRPLEELAGIVATAKEIGARAVWCQSGLASAGAKDPKGCWVPDEASRERGDSLSRRAWLTSKTSTSRTPSASSPSTSSTPV